MIVLVVNITRYNHCNVQAGTKKHTSAPECTAYVIYGQCDQREAGVNA